MGFIQKSPNIIFKADRQSNCLRFKILLCGRPLLEALLEVIMERKGTIKQIQEYTKSHFGYSAKSCWIADVKSQCGIYVKPAWNRIDKKKREVPCPPNKIKEIQEALKFSELI